MSFRMSGGGFRHWLWVLCALAGIAQAQVPADPYNYSRTSSFTYRSDGLLQSETIEPDNVQSCVVTTYDYDAYGNKRSATTGNCPGASGRALFTTRTSSSTFAAVGSQVIVANGASVTVSVAAGAFATSSSNALGHAETRKYDPRFGAVLELTGPNALTTRWELDDFGRRTREIRADNASSVTHYCVIGAGLDTSANSSACPTPAAGEVPVDAVMFVHSESRDASGTKMGPFSRVYTDRLGREVRAVTESFDGTAQPAGRSGVLVAKDTVYSSYGAKTIETQPYFLASGSSTTAGASDMGLVRTEYDALGRPVFVYVADARGSMAGVSFGSYGTRTASRQTLTYGGLTTIAINDKGQTRKEEKNANGQVVRVTDSTGTTVDNGAQIAYQHDAFGNLVKTKDALQNVITVQFDIRGRKTQMTDPDAGLTMYDYDALGQLVWLQSAKQRAATPAPTATTMVYDVLGRMTQRTTPEYASNWHYDRYADASECAKGIGKLCGTSTSHGITRKTVFDSLGRPISNRTSVSGGPSMAGALSYDSVTGRVASQTYPTGARVSYAYTGRGFLERLTLITAATINPLPAAPGGATGTSTNLPAGTLLWQAQRVNAWGRAEQQYFGNGVTGRAAFEAATGRTSALTAGIGSSTSVLDHAYTWDSLNNVTARIDANGDGNTGAVSESFEYGDKLNRLTRYTVAAPAIPNLSRTVELQYNALGMLLYKSDVGAYAYGAAGGTRPHALLSITGAVNTSFSYDANGNMVTASAGKYRSVAYTSFNLPDSQEGVAGPNGSPRYTWQYDEDQSRIKETRVITGGTFAGTRTTWKLHPDNQGGLGFESEENVPTSPSAANPAVTSNRHFLSAGGQVIAVMVSTGALPTLGSTQTTPPSITSITLVKLEYWHKDHLGSIAATTDHAGNLTGRFAYDPFGKRRYTNGQYDAFGELVVDWSSATNNGTDRGYTGHEHLDDIGLIHMNGRIFDPTLGVFLQTDPLVQDAFNLQNYNRYAYCYNNPVTCTDPSGYFNLFRTLMRIGDIGTTASVLGTGDFATAYSVWRLLNGPHGYQIKSLIVSSLSSYCGPAAFVCNGFGQAMLAQAYGADTAQAAKVGFVSGMATLANQAVGATFPTGADASWGSVAANTVAHAAVGCLSAKHSGGDCRSGAISGGVSASFTNYFGEYVSSNTVIGTMQHALIGGIAAEASGGKFWNGAFTGAYGYLFNALAHDVLANRSAGLAFESAVVEELERAGYALARNVEIKFAVSSGEIVTAIADFMYVRDGTVVIGEVKWGANAKLSPGQKTVYDAIITGKNFAIESGALARAGISPEVYATAMRRFDLVVSELSGRAARQAFVRWGIRAVRLLTIPVQVGIELMIYTKDAD